MNFIDTEELVFDFIPGCYHNAVTERNLSIILCYTYIRNNLNHNVLVYHVI